MTVLFGSAPEGTLDLDASDASGFKIIGSNLLEEGEDISCRPAAAGDVNGDGLDDVLVGDPGSDNNMRNNSGTVYVVFGKTDEETVDLAEFDQNRQFDQGFRIDGGSRLGEVGFALAGIGDLNEDGLDDLVVGGPFAGGAFVVFGKDDVSSVDLALFNQGMQGDAGFVIDAPIPTTNGNGYSLAGPGDVNDDGTPDILFGFVRYRNTYGSAYVIFGKSDTASVDIRDLGTRGFRIRGARRGDAVGYSVAGVGDMNHDGRADLLVGAPDVATAKDTPDTAHVVFGKSSTSTIELRRLGKRGFRIRGDDLRYGDSLGHDVAGVGDIDGDGTPDILVGAIFARRPNGAVSGAAYLIFGKSGKRTVDVRDLGRSGITIYGERHRDWAGNAVAGPGDVNGDGIPDLMIGAGAILKTYVLWGTPNFR